jgi:hypothetical protein
MGNINERNISRYLRKPFGVYVADTGGVQPAVPSFYTEPAISIAPTGEFDSSMAYGECSENSAVLMTVRKDLKSFQFIANWQIKETTITTLQLSYGGSKDSGGATLRFDGTQPAKKKYWLESCYADDDKIIRITIPVGRASEFAEVPTGDGYALLPNSVEALVDPADSTSFVTIYIEA